MRGHVGLLAWLLISQADANSLRKLEEENYICEELESQVFWNVAEGSPETPCISQMQNRTNFVQDDGGKESLAWDGNFTEVACTAQRSVTWYSTPVSVDEPCVAEVQTSTFDSEVNCDGTPCSSATLGLWSAFNGSFAYESCVEIQSQERFQRAAAPTKDECILETQVRERENFGEWRAWSGSYLFETCVQGVVQTEGRIRWQAASVEHPLTCIYEEQTRGRFCITAAQTVEDCTDWDEWGGWSGSYEQAECQVRDIIPFDAEAPESRAGTTGFYCPATLTRLKKFDGKNLAKCTETTDESRPADAAACAAVTGAALETGDACKAAAAGACTYKDKACTETASNFQACANIINLATGAECNAVNKKSDSSVPACTYDDLGGKWEESWTVQQCDRMDCMAHHNAVRFFEVRLAPPLAHHALRRTFSARPAGKKLEAVHGAEESAPAGLDGRGVRGRGRRTGLRGQGGQAGCRPAWQPRPTTVGNRHTSERSLHVGSRDLSAAWAPFLR
jgi:hypothetical protein